MSQPFTLQHPPSSEPPTVLKWVGSKGTLAPHLCSLLVPALEQGGRYFEPFAGSLAVFFMLRSLGWRGQAELSDILAPLVNFYTQIFVGAETPYRVLCDIEEGYQGAEDKSEFFKRQRALLNEGRGGPTYRAGLLLWINHRCFNGLWRTNGKGEFTTDWGGERNYLPSLTRLRAAEKFLENTEIRCCDFEDSIDKAGQGDVIYADPPYAQGYRYYAGNFSEQHQVRLASCLRVANERGATVVASNADTPAVRELYAWAEQQAFSLEYGVGGANRKTGKELILYRQGAA